MEYLIGHKRGGGYRIGAFGLRDVQVRFVG